MSSSGGSGPGAMYWRDMSLKASGTGEHLGNPRELIYGTVWVCVYRIHYCVMTMMSETSDMQISAAEENRYRGGVSFDSDDQDRGEEGEVLYI